MGKLNHLFLVILVYLFFVSTCLAQQEIETLLIKLDSTKRVEEKLLLYKQAAFYYQNDKAYLKAIEYFQKANDLQKGIDAEKRQDILQSLAYNYTQLKKYPEAINVLEELLKLNGLDNSQKNTIYTHLTLLAKQNNDYKKATAYAQTYITNLENAKNNLELVQAYNNLGVIFQESSNTTEAVNAFQKGLTLGLQLEQSLKELSQKATLYLNLGTAFTHLGDFQSAKYHFIKALEIWEKQKNAHKIAQVRNYLAANFYVAGNNTDAINYAQQAAELARLNNDEETISVSYQILAMAYQVEGEVVQSQQYQNLSTQLAEKIREQNRKAEQEQAYKQLEIEKKENEIRSLIAAREKQAMSLAQAELERQKQEKELALLKREQELQQAELKAQELEKERIRQLLVITQQQALADRQAREVEKQTLIAEKERIEREKANAQIETEKTARQLAESQKQQQEKQLEQEQQIRQFGYVIIGLIGISLIVMIFSFVNARKTAKRLAKQNKIIEEQSQEIQSQNEELFQNQEEILAQRDAIADKNMELESRNRFIQKSIGAALNIQQAILPYKAKLDELLKDYFIIYRPKDVVSGDFYWLNKIGEKIVLVVADCTGHSVQGAFMTLIGNTLLDKIVRVWDITDPTQILSRLHEEIAIVLRQEDTKNDDGMDLVVVCMEKESENNTKIIFSGAKSNLYYIIASGKPVVQVLKGTRKSIGGKQNPSKIFENQEIILPKNSFIYAGSDGLQDQNNTERVRFGERNIIKILEENCHLSLAEQKQALEHALNTHMKNTEQRDDILWIGVRV